MGNLEKEELARILHGYVIHERSRKAYISLTVAIRLTLLSFTAACVATALFLVGGDHSWTIGMQTALAAIFLTLCVMTAVEDRNGKVQLRAGHDKSWGLEWRWSAPSRH